MEHKQTPGYLSDSCAIVGVVIEHPVGHGAHKNGRKNSNKIKPHPERSKLDCELNVVLGHVIINLELSVNFFLNLLLLLSLDFLLYN